MADSIWGLLLYAIGVLTGLETKGWLADRAVRRRTRPDNLMALADALHDTRDSDERRNR